MKIINWGTDIKIGLSWEKNGEKNIDLDVSAVLYDVVGALHDAVYFNQYAAKDGSILHSGDNKTGELIEEDETMIIFTSRIHPAVKAIVIIVNMLTKEEILVKFHRQLRKFPIYQQEKNYFKFV